MSKSKLIQEKVSFSFQGYEYLQEKSIFDNKPILEILDLLISKYLDPCSYKYINNGWQLSIKCFSILGGAKDVILNLHVLSNPSNYIFILSDSNLIFCLTSQELVECINPISHRLKVEDGDGFYSLNYKDKKSLKNSKGAYIYIINNTYLLDLQSWLFTFDEKSPLFSQELFVNIKKNSGITPKQFPTPFSFYDLFTKSNY